MPSPFPGMDPYLENPAHWPDFHLELISVVKQLLNDQVLPRYYALAEDRIYIAHGDPTHPGYVPDVSVRLIGDLPSHGIESRTAVSEPIERITMLDDEIHEPYLAIYDRESRRIVTVIEVLSPSNKTAGSDGFHSYRAKRSQLQKSSTNLVEIDLLRAGAKMLVVPEVQLSDYYVHISRPDRRPLGFVWPILLSQRLPEIGIPLSEQDSDARLDLQTAVDTVYDRSRYDAVLDYRREPIPPLPSHYSEWADALLREKGLRAAS